MKKLIRLLRVLLFVIYWHGGQRRKYTGFPYFFHLIAVAYKLHKAEKSEKAIVTALCHDLFEDTDCTQHDIRPFLRKLGYNTFRITSIIDGIHYLTDEFTTEDYPDWNRKKRKEFEALRLSKIPKWCQTIKYADLIDNTRSIIRHDKGFAKVYLEEKGEILKIMRRGDTKLLVEAIITLEIAKKKL